MSHDDDDFLTYLGSSCLVNVIGMSFYVTKLPFRPSNLQNGQYPHL